VLWKWSPPAVRWRLAWAHLKPMAPRGGATGDLAAAGPGCWEGWLLKRDLDHLSSDMISLMSLTGQVQTATLGGNNTVRASSIQRSDRPIASAPPAELRPVPAPPQKPKPGGFPTRAIVYLKKTEEAVRAVACLPSASGLRVPPIVTLHVTTAICFGYAFGR